MPGTLEVQGEGRAAAVPDYIRLSFDVSSIQDEYWDTIQGLNEKTDELRSSLESAGVKRSEIKTVDFKVSQRWKSIEKINKVKKERTTEQVFDGYAARHSLRVEMKHEKKRVNRILSKISSGEHGAYLEVQFFVSDLEGMRKHAIAAATRVARENAEILAREAGVKLGKVKNISYGWSEVRIRRSPSMELMEALGSEAMPDFEPDEISDSQRVSMIYDIE